MNNEEERIKAIFDTVEVLHERIFAACEELRRELAALERHYRESVPALATVEARELLATYAEAARQMAEALRTVLLRYGFVKRAGTPGTDTTIEGFPHE